MVQKWQNLLIWCEATENVPLSAQEVCATRDVFQARLDGFLRLLIKNGVSSSDAALLVAITGELGNNSFDHNIGHWRDQTGCWFEYTINDQAIHVAIADRGQGIWNSLKSIDPKLDSPQKAIDAAFEKVISGRYPENRGNGLKFVRSVINNHGARGLVCFSDSGVVSFGGLGATLKQEILNELPAPVIAKGTCSIIDWKFS